MTVTEMAPIVGRTVEVRFESVTIACRVLDAKTAWNRGRLLIEPVAGTGRQWVETGRIMGISAQQEAISA